MPQYIKEGEGEVLPALWVRLEESYSNREYDSPLLPCWKRKEEGRKRKRGAPPPFLVLFGLGGRGRAACPGRPSSSPLGPM